MMCVNLNSLAGLIIRETIHGDIVMGWLLPLLKQTKNTFIFVNSVTKNSVFSVFFKIYIKRFGTY